MSDTSTVAAQVISEMSTPEPASVDSHASTNAVASFNPDAAVAEVKHLLRDRDESDYTARIAAINIAKADPREWKATPYGGIRREHVPSGYGSELTSKAAREVIDAASMNALATPAERQERELAAGLDALSRELGSEQ